MSTIGPIKLNIAALREAQAKRARTSPKVSPQAEAVNRKLLELEKLWRQIQGTRRRDAIYGFLRELFDLARDWKDRRRGDCLVQHVQAFAGTEIDLDAEVYSITIKATTDADEKITSKLSRVLRYCERAKPNDQRLKQFIKRAGGLNACASLFTREFGTPRCKSKSPEAKRK